MPRSDHQGLHWNSVGVFFFFFFYTSTSWLFPFCSPIHLIVWINTRSQLATIKRAPPSPLQLDSSFTDSSAIWWWWMAAAAARITIMMMLFRQEWSKWTVLVIPGHPGRNKLRWGLIQTGLDVWRGVIEKLGDCTTMISLWQYNYISNYTRKVIYI